MDPIAVMAAAGIRARMEALDMLSNNLANSTTGGYKLDREFYSLFQGEEDSGASSSGSTMPVIEKKWTDFKQGELQPTGNPLDLALNGKGFFAVNGPSGTYYTRNGAFKLSPTGLLTSSEGYAVRLAGGGFIQSTGRGPIEVNENGFVSQAGQALGQLEVVDFADPSVLNKVGGSYFQTTDTKARPIQAIDTGVEQGKIESSNVAPAESAVRLVELMRQYEMLQKAVLLSSEMNKKATEEIAKVGA